MSENTCPICRKAWLHPAILKCGCIFCVLCVANSFPSAKRIPCMSCGVLAQKGDVRLLNAGFVAERQDEKTSLHNSRVLATSTDEIKSKRDILRKTSKEPPPLISSLHPSGRLEPGFVLVCGSPCSGRTALVETFVATAPEHGEIIYVNSQHNSAMTQTESISIIGPEDLQRLHERLEKNASESDKPTLVVMDSCELRREALVNLRHIQHNYKRYKVCVIVVYFSNIPKPILEHFTRVVMTSPVSISGMPKESWSREPECFSSTSRHGKYCLVYAQGRWASYEYFTRHQWVVLTQDAILHANNIVSTFPPGIIPIIVSYCWANVLSF